MAWIRRYILFHNERHPMEMGAAEVTQFLTALAVERKVAASTQNQALGALLFLHREVLQQNLPWLDDVVRARRPQHVPVVMTREALAPGSDADIVLIDPEVRKRLSLTDLHAADHSAWEGWEVHGWPVLTILRGKVVVENGTLLGDPADGRLIGGRKTRPGPAYDSVRPPCGGRRGLPAGRSCCGRRGTPSRCRHGFVPGACRPSIHRRRRPSGSNR